MRGFALCLVDLALISLRYSRVASEVLPLIRTRRSFEDLELSRTCSAIVGSPAQEAAFNPKWSNSVQYGNMVHGGSYRNTRPSSHIFFCRQRAGRTSLPESVFLRTWFSLFLCHTPNTCQYFSKWQQTKHSYAIWTEIYHKSRTKKKSSLLVGLLIHNYYKTCSYFRPLSCFQVSTVGDYLLFHNHLGSENYDLSAALPTRRPRVFPSIFLRFNLTSWILRICEYQAI